ncbi:MAG TPA: hypothetical protein V6C78_14900 [Crinalium sp.]|jgi:hypothetical protein
MDFDLEAALPSLLSAILPILVSLLDDALLLGLARLGWNWPWLHWVSIIVVAATVIYWVIHIFRSKFVRNFLNRKMAEVKSLLSGDRPTSEEN